MDKIPRVVRRHAANISVAVPPHAQSLALETATNGGRESIRFQRCYSWLRNFTLSCFAAGTM